MRTKKEVKFFNIVQYEQEAEYLRNMHKSGWKFVKMTGLGMYHFVECEPEDVVYQLDYNQDGLKNRDEYVQMFEDCGWEYLQDAFGYSYFRKPASEMNGKEEIFCDDESRLEMMKRVFKGRVWPLVILYPTLLINLFNGFWVYRVPALTFSIGALVVLYTVIFIRFAVQYYKYTKDKTI